jgi:hypothetical protein
VLYACEGDPVICKQDKGTINGINVFREYEDEDGDPFIKLIDHLDSTDLKSEKYQLFDCKSGTCSRTSGYIQYGKDLTATGRCPYDADCTVQSGADEIGFTGKAGTLRFSGSDFTYTVNGGAPKVITPGDNYFFVDRTSKYDYISFSNANVVASFQYDIRNKEYDVYINIGTNVVGKGAENCNSNSYYHYVIGDENRINSYNSVSCKNTEATAGNFLKECEEATIQSCTSTNPASKYCYYEDKIYTLDEDGACTTAAAIDLVSTPSSRGVKIFDFATMAEADTTGELSNLEKIVLFNCFHTYDEKKGDYTRCVRTYGYVKTDNNKYYRIGADGINEEIVAGTADTTTGVLNPSTFKLNVGDGVEFVSDDNSSSYLVELLDNNIFLSSEDYSIANAVFKTHIIIWAISNTFIYKNFYDGEIPVLKYKLVSNLDSSSMIAENINDSFDSIYICNTEGLCKLSVSFDEPGKYIIHDRLYVCEGDPIVCSKDDGTNDGLNVFKLYDIDENDNKLFKLIEDLTSADLEKEKYQIFDCESAVCYRINGYIKYGEGHSSIGRCPEYDDCTIQTEADETGFDRLVGTLKFTGTGFTFTFYESELEYEVTKDLIPGNEYFFAYGEPGYIYEYEYISFKTEYMVAFISILKPDLYINSSTNAIVNDVENCNSDTYYHYILENEHYRHYKFDSAQCVKLSLNCPLSDNNVIIDDINTLDEDGACSTLQAITLTEGIKIFDLKTKSEADTTGELSNLESIVLLNCFYIGNFMQFQCKRTYGYVKTDNNKYYRIGADGKNEEVESGDADTKVGVLNPATFKLNVSGAVSSKGKVLDQATFQLNVEDGVDFSDESSASVYLVKLEDNGVFLSSEDYNTAITNSKTHIWIISVSNTFVFDNIFNDDQLCALLLTDSYISVNNRVGHYDFELCEIPIYGITHCPLSINSEINDNKCPNGYYLKANDNSKLADTAEVGILYKCVNQSCSALDGTAGYEFVYGIVPNADATNKDTIPYIACTGSASCTTIALSDGSDCSDVDQGGIISTGENAYDLCVVGNSATGGVTITTPNDNKYILPITVFNSRDNTGKYILVSFDGVNVTKDVSNTRKYIYAGNDNKIYNKSENNEICADEFYEYKKEDQYIYEKQNS